MPSCRAQPRDHMWYDLLPTLPAARMRHTFTGLFHGGVWGGCELASLILQMFPWIFCLGCFALSIWVTASFPTLTLPPTCSKPVHQNQYTQQHPHPQLDLFLVFYWKKCCILCFSKGFLRQFELGRFCPNSRSAKAL